MPAIDLAAIPPPEALAVRCKPDNAPTMARKKRYLTATLPDGYVKTIGPTDAPFTHYWRIVAALANGGTEVFWGHAKSLKEAKSRRAPAEDAAKQRGWVSFRFDIVELTESSP